MNFEFDKQKRKAKLTAIIIFCVAVVAFVIRVQVCRELAANDPQVSNPSSYTDMWTYRSLSERIVKGEFEAEYYYQPFYYAVFLPILKYLLGFGIWPVIFAQCLLSAVTVWLAGATAARLWKGIAGVAAAILTALSSTLILYTAFHLIATLQAFWIVLLAYLCVRGLEASDYRVKSFVRRMAEWAGIGFVTGLAILTRGNIWFFVPGILLVLSIAEFALIPPDTPSANLLSHRCKALLPAVLFLFMTIAPQIPFAWRNSSIRGAFTGPSTAAGSVLCLGDTPESPPGGREAGSGPGPMEYPDTCKAWSAKGDTASVAGEIMRWACREPLAFIELQFRKCLLFWDYREIPNNVAIEMDGLRSPTLTTLGLLPLLDVKTPMGPRKIIFMDLLPFPATLLLFGFAGAILAFRRITFKLLRKRRIRLSEVLLLYFVIAYWLGTAAFYILARFRAPVTPLLAIFAGGFIFHSYKLLMRDRKSGGKAALSAVFAFLFAGAVVFAGYNMYRTHLEPTIMRFARPDGVASQLDDSTWLLKDNGPTTFGGWMSQRVQDDMTIKKKFVISPDVKKDSNVKLRLSMIWNTPGTAEITVNGKSFHAFSRVPRRETREFEIPFPIDGEVEITFTRIDSELYVFLDTQRNYARTSIDGKPSRSELVANLFIKRKNH